MSNKQQEKGTEQTLIESINKILVGITRARGVEYRRGEGRRVKESRGGYS